MSAHLERAKEQLAAGCPDYAIASAVIAIAEALEAMSQPYRGPDEATVAFRRANPPRRRGE